MRTRNSINLTQYPRIHREIKLGTTVSVRRLSMELIEAAKVNYNDIYIMKDIACMVQQCMKINNVYLIQQRLKLVIQLVSRNLDKYCQSLINNRKSPKLRVIRSLLETLILLGELSVLWYF